MTEIKFLPYYDKIIQDYETSDYLDDVHYMENLRRWLRAEYGANMVSDNYGNNHSTPVLQFETDKQATLFALRYR